MTSPDKNHTKGSYSSSINMKSAKVRSFRASSAACRDCVAAGCDEDAPVEPLVWVWDGSEEYVEEMGYAKPVFDMIVGGESQVDFSDFLGVWTPYNYGDEFFSTFALVHHHHAPLVSLILLILQ